MMMIRIFLCAACLLSLSEAWSQELTDEERVLAAGHPRPSYEGVEDIDAMAAALRKHLAGQGRQSFSRGWWRWDRLRARYVDGGRVAANELKILHAAFRALIFDWHDKLVSRGEGDLFYIFFVTTAPGDKKRRTLGDRVLIRDLHGGGYHGGWGGAPRMRIFEELAARGLLTAEGQGHFQHIVYQSISPRFLDFKRGSQNADNHSYGNGGGIALALKRFPDAPQAEEARAWLDRIWDGSLADFGDWQEWTYYPYGPIFLHGMLDIAEATGKIDTERDLINTVGQRVLKFVHGSGVRGNPNSGARVGKNRSALYANPWNVGYYDIEQSPRDGHFWYRMAQHYEDPEYLWAAEQIILGGRPPSGEVPPEYQAAYHERFAWLVKRGIRPRRPEGKASVGLLSPEKHKIPERLYLSSGRAAGEPFAAYFLHDKKSGHLDNVAGQLFEYSFDGAKLLHTSGKYNNTGKGGATGEESLDSLLVIRRVHPFPQHPDGDGNERDFRRRGPSALDPASLKAENNETGDSFGQFSFDHYYGKGSRWVRRTVLTEEGYLIVADEYRGGEVLGNEFAAGPVWHLGVDETTPGPREQNWFDAPAIDHAWWQSEQKRVLLYFHDDRELKFGSLEQSHSQDVDPNRTTFAYRPIGSGRAERFLSVFVPHAAATPPEQLAAAVTTRISAGGDCAASIGHLTATIRPDGSWGIERKPAAPQKELIRWE